MQMINHHEFGSTKVLQFRSRPVNATCVRPAHRLAPRSEFLEDVSEGSFAKGAVVAFGLESGLFLCIYGLVHILRLFL
jgi:hypothetical protein